MITVSEQQIREVLLAVLDEGNPFSTIEWEFSSGFDDVSQINREDFCSEVASRLKSLSKLTDHCTEEERAVIDKALAWLEWVDQLQKLSDAEVKLVNATAALRHRRLLAT